MITQNTKYNTSFFKKKNLRGTEEVLCLKRMIKSFSNDRVGQRKKKKYEDFRGQWLTMLYALRLSVRRFVRIFGLA